jgi:peptide/nickel transport system permease protein
MDELSRIDIAAPLLSSAERRHWSIRIWDSDLAYSFRHSPATIIAAALTLLCIAGALLAPWIAPHNPFDLKTLDLLDSLLPPAWRADGKATYLLGTDNQGRDVLSAIMFGTRLSLLVGFGAVLFAILLGVTLGLVAGYAGGRWDALIMRVRMFSFPSRDLIALLIDGVARLLLPALCTIRSRYIARHRDRSIRLANVCAHGSRLDLVAQQ